MLPCFTRSQINSGELQPENLKIFSVAAESLHLKGKKKNNKANVKKIFVKFCQQKWNKWQV